MAEITPRPGWSRRRLVSFLLILSFLGVTVSGVILFIKPLGKVARAINWSLWGMGKDQWEMLHTGLSLLLLVVAIYHFWLNWGAVRKYCRDAWQKSRSGTREFVAALVLFLLVVAGSLADLPPFSTLREWNGSLKTWWAEPLTKSPAPAAQTLRALCHSRGLDLKEVQATLARKSITATGNEPVNDLAEKLGYPTDEFIKHISGE